MTNDKPDELWSLPLGPYGNARAQGRCGGPWAREVAEVVLWALQLNVTTACAGKAFKRSGANEAEDRRSRRLPLRESLTAFGLELAALKLGSDRVAARGGSRVDLATVSTVKAGISWPRPFPGPPPSRDLPAMPHSKQHRRHKHFLPTCKRHPAKASLRHANVI